MRGRKRLASWRLGSRHPTAGHGALGLHLGNGRRSLIFSSSRRAPSCVARLRGAACLGCRCACLFHCNRPWKSLRPRLVRRIAAHRKACSPPLSRRPGRWPWRWHLTGRRWAYRGDGQGWRRRRFAGRGCRRQLRSIRQVAGRGSRGALRRGGRQPVFSPRDV